MLTDGMLTDGMLIEGMTKFTFAEGNTTDALPTFTFALTFADGMLTFTFGPEGIEGAFVWI